MSYLYGRPLGVKVQNGALIIEIGVDVLAHAVTYADWANPFDEQANDYVRTFAISDATVFANDVKRAMLNEREDGSSPLTDFLDAVAEATVDDGSIACEFDQAIKYGETAPCEARWASGLHSVSESSPEDLTHD